MRHIGTGRAVGLVERALGFTLARGAASTAIVALSIALPMKLRAQRTSTGDRASADRIAWVDGPVRTKLGKVAELSVPAGCNFTGSDGARKVMELTQNPPDGTEVGVVVCPDSTAADHPYWFVVFSYDASGYVRDDEGKMLDADAILTSIRRSTEQGNQERRSRGWEALTIDGWVRPPFYDAVTHNLTWSLRAHSDSGAPVVNHSVRLLGRGGVMRADLVIAPIQLATAVPSFDRVIAGLNFLPGHTYAEWRQGDKVAAYGLTALVAGGAGAAAMKLGLFAKLWKFLAGLAVALWKAVVAAVVAAVAWLRSLFRRKSRTSAPPGAGAGGRPGAT